MVPVVAIGFSDLKKRIDSQEQQTQAHVLKISEMQVEADAIERKHQLETTPKLREYKRRQAAIAHKLLQVN
jgi:nuclear pore complex protein Nup54